MNSSRDNGKIWLTKSLRILSVRDSANRQLRKLPSAESKKRKLNEIALDFLRDHKEGVFEKDNLSHVGRLMASMQKYEKPLHDYLGVSSEDAELLAVLHDLGKSKIAEPIYQELLAVFPKTDFLSLRILPHELYSMYWIEELGMAEKWSPSELNQLMDLIACHNFGPNPQGLDLTKHWWMRHWKEWADKVRTKGYEVSGNYGYVESPLAYTLVLFDRIDGGDPHSWEKYLNQDFVSGNLQFTAKNIIALLKESNVASFEQVKATGNYLKALFLEKHALDPLQAFSPYHDALMMLEKSRQVLERLENSNRPEMRERLGVIATDCILHQDFTDQWWKVSIVKQNPIQSRKFLWQNSTWKETEESDNPVELLISLL